MSENWTVEELPEAKQIRVDLNRGQMAMLNALKEAYKIPQTSEMMRTLVQDAFDNIDTMSPLTKAERAYLRDWNRVQRGFYKATIDEIEEALGELSLTKPWLQSKMKAAVSYVWGLKR